MFFRELWVPRDNEMTATHFRSMHESGASIARKSKRKSGIILKPQIYKYMYYIYIYICVCVCVCFRFQDK